MEGPNGCGKTTLLRALCGLLLPVEGDIRWRGRAVRQSRSEFQAELAYVGHTPGIKEDLSPSENLRMEAALGIAKPKLDTALVLEQLGLARQAELPCRNLSAGQRRRAGLGRLLVRQTLAWFLDEPFTAIDRSGVEQLAEIMASHVRGGGLMVLTTHQQVRFPGIEPHVLRLGR